MRIAQEFTNTCYAHYENGMSNLELELVFTAAYVCEVQEVSVPYVQDSIKSVVSLAMMQAYAEGCDPENLEGKASEALSAAAEKISEELARNQEQLIELKITSIYLAEDSKRIYERTKSLNELMAGSIAMAAAAPVMQPQPVQVPQPAAPATGVRWICTCGTINSGKFCVECGSKKNFDRLLCSCGKEGSGKFCTECGQKLQ